MAELGADPDQLDMLARKFDEEAQKIESIISSVASQLGGTWWRGSDRDHFENQWTTTYTSELRKVIASFNDAAGNCRKQASQQRQTSAA